MVINNIIFDWSGTISNDLLPVWKASSYTFKYFGIKPLTLKEFRTEFILPYMNFYSKFKKDISKKECDEVFFKKFKLLREPKPFPKVKLILRYLKLKGIKLIILSSHPQKEIEKELKRYKLGDYFRCIYGGIHDKTSGIVRVIKDNKLKRRETAFVGDMTSDIKAGKKTKVITIAVTWGYHLKDKLLEAKPDYIINNFYELKRIISDTENNKI